MRHLRVFVVPWFVLLAASAVGCGADGEGGALPAPEDAAVPDTLSHDVTSEEAIDATTDRLADALADTPAFDGGDSSFEDAASDSSQDSAADVVDGAASSDAAGDAPNDVVSPDAATLPPMPDFTLGPYPSALDLLIRSIHSNSTALDSTKNYGHVAAQGYVIQAAARLLSASSGYALPGGEATRDAIVADAIGEARELIQVSDKVVGGGPAYGLSKAWDAFGDGSTNPAYTAYAWQSGMVVLGLAELYSYLHANAAKYSKLASDIELLRVFVGQMLDLWNAHYSSHTENGETVGFFWYSTQQSDAIAVHNTNALLAMASQVYAEAGGGDQYKVRPVQAARLLRARWSTTAKGGLSWHYCDDGYPASKRTPEDVSHALLTLQFIRLAHDHGWYDDGVSAKVSKTLLSQMWSGNPARLHGRVDGSSGGSYEWTWTSAAVIGFAAQAGVQGGRADVFDYARSLLVSSFLTPNGVALQGASVDSARTLALAELVRRKPGIYAPDSVWITNAGPGDDTNPTTPGGVRFYYADWNAPAKIADAKGLSLTARLASTSYANFLVDLTPGQQTKPVVVSLTYKSSSPGSVQQWNGSAYSTVASLPATQDKNGNVVWMRTSFHLNQGLRYDYQPTVPGDNVLFQVTSLPAIAELEATPTGP